MRMLSFLLGVTAVAWSAGVIADAGNLCRAGESAVWSCRVGTKYYSLCASTNLGAQDGYLQYRAGRPSRLEFRFPGRLIHPRGHFSFGLLAHGASLEFEHGAYHYAISEDLKGETSILVRLPQGRTASIDCADATQTLTENATIDLFKAADLAE